jgi:hypothetical protein
MAIGEHEPLAGAHFPNDVLSHFKRPGSKLTQHCNVAGRLSGFRLDAAVEFGPARAVYPLSRNALD